MKIFNYKLCEITCEAVNSSNNLYDWWNQWKNIDPNELWKIWTTSWKDWVPDPAKTYVSSPIELPVKVNPIFRGREPPPPVEKNLCSVIMPFGKKKIDGSVMDFDSVYNDCIMPPLEHAGFRVMRADDIFEPGNYITENIWRLINRSALLVADVTDKNPNVFYELGIAHTVGRDVILISQRKEDVPFDIQSLRYYLYTTDNEKGRQKLREDLANLMKDTKSRVTHPSFWLQI